MIGMLWCIAVPSASRAQKQAGSADTLPAHVVQRALDAFNRHDSQAIMLAYDSIYTHEILTDSGPSHRVNRQAMRDTIVAYFRDVREASAKLTQRIVDGPFVVDLYNGVNNGKPYQHLDIYEVRNGRIVREWEY